MAAISEWKKRHEDWRSQTYAWLRRDVNVMDAIFFTDTAEIEDIARSDLSGKRLIEIHGTIYHFDRALLDRELANLTKLIERLG